MVRARVDNSRMKPAYAEPTISTLSDSRHRLPTRSGTHGKTDSGSMAGCSPPGSMACWAPMESTARRPNGGWMPRCTRADSDQIAWLTGSSGSKCTQSQKPEWYGPFEAPTRMTSSE